jgi:hypothetical protein
LRNRSIKKQSITAAVAQAALFDPVPSAVAPVNIEVHPGTYIFTSALTISVGIVVNTRPGRGTYLWVLGAYVDKWLIFDGGSITGGPYNTVLVTNGLCRVCISSDNGTAVQLSGITLLGNDTGLDILGNPTVGIECINGGGIGVVEGIVTGFDVGVQNISGGQTFLFTCGIFGPGLLNYVDPTYAMRIGVEFSGIALLLNGCNILQCTETGVVSTSNFAPFFNPLVSAQSCNFQVCDTAISVPSGNTDLQVLSTGFSNNITGDLSVLSNDALVNLLGTTLNAAKVTLPSDPSNVSLQFIDLNIDNSRGLHTFNDLVSGDKRLPSESYFGEGGRNPLGVVMLKYDVVGTTYTDVTADLLESASVSTVVFDDLVSGEFYIGDDYVFQSFVMHVDVIIALGAGALIIEIWNGSAWTATDSNTQQNLRPYESYADTLFSVVEEEVTRMDVRLGGVDLPWVLTTVNGSEKYWMRIRVISTITTSPSIEHSYPLYDSTRIDLEGIRLSYGTSRAYKTLQFDWNNFRPTGSAATRPQDHDFWFGEFSRLGREYNSFRAAGGDRVGTVFFVPVDADTSSPFKLFVSFTSDSATAGQVDFELTITTGDVSVGGVTYVTAAAAAGNAIADELRTVVTLTPDQTVGTSVALAETDIALQYLVARDAIGEPNTLLSLDIERAGGDLNANNINIIQISLLYLSNIDGAPRG